MTTKTSKKTNKKTTRTANVNANVNANANANPIPKPQTAAPAAHSPKIDQDLERSLNEVIDLGRAWARYGLEVGSRALATSAKSLAVTSSLLQTISDQLDPPPATSATSAHKDADAAGNVTARAA